MLLKILRYIFGYIKVSVVGFAPERFMNLIIKNEIVIWDVECNEQGYTFYTGRKNLLKMKPYLQKTNMKMKLQEKCGLPFYFKKNKRRAAFLIGFLMFACTIYILSLFIWEVKVTGENKLVAETILKKIEKDYISLGTMKKSVDCLKLEEALRKDFSEISWISCELKGTVLVVYLEEGMLPKKENKDNITGDIVAGKDADITKMVTRQGTPMAKVKDHVKKGDILISGTIYIYDDNNEVMETSYIAADGDVYGTTVQTYEDYIDLKFYQKNYKKKSKNYITFFWMDYSYTPYISKMKTDQYDSITQIHKAKISNNFYLPFGYKIVKRTEYTLEQKEYKEAVAKKILQERFNKKMKDFEKKGVEIIKNDVKIEKENGRLIAKGTLTLKESIAVFKKTSGAITGEIKDE